MTEQGVFRVRPLTPQRRAAIEAYYGEHGYVVLRDVFTAEEVDELEYECTTAQADVLAGRVGERYGSTKFLDMADKAESFVNYVEHAEELSPAVRAAATNPVMVELIRGLIGERAWLNDETRDGVIYQDARPGRESGYTRIGWHSDWQSGPSLSIWPSTAFTIHIDGTSPANGFLRVVPGSHRWWTPAPYRNVNNAEVPADAQPAGGYTTTPPPVEMPLGFDKVPGEVAVYVDRGDVILHDGYLWHSAARATDDETMRRHIRAGYFGGAYTERRQFVKNAAR